MNTKKRKLVSGHPAKNVDTQMKKPGVAINSEEAKSCD